MRPIKSMVKPSAGRGPFRHGDYLDRRICEGVVTSNIVEWIDLWTTEKLPSYGERYARQLREREFDPVITQVIPFIELDLEDRDAFIPSPEQRAELAMLPADEREDRRRFLTNVWVRNQRAKNAISIRENERIKAEYSDSLKFAREDAGINSKIFVDVLKHMSQISRDRVRQYSEDRKPEDLNDGDDAQSSISTVQLQQGEVNADDVSQLSVATAVILEERGSPEYESAKLRNDWVWLFKAAFNSHAISSQGDAYSKTEEITALKSRVESLSMQRQEYFSWITRMKREIQMAELVGVTWTDVQKVSFIVRGLNPVVFSTFLENWRNTEIRRRWPVTFEGMLVKIKEHYEAVDPYVIVSQRKPERVESVMVAEETHNVKEAKPTKFARPTSRGGPRRDSDKPVEKSVKVATANPPRQDSRRGCFLCRAGGKGFHTWKSCPLYEPGVPLDDQIDFWTKQPMDVIQASIQSIRSTLIFGPEVDLIV